jgi:uncharacterized membrane protein
MPREESQPNGGAPMDRLRSEVGSLVGALGERAVGSVRDRVEGTAGRLAQYVEGGGGPGIMAALTGARGLAEGKSPMRSMFGAGMAGLKEKVRGMFGGKGGGGKKLKVINIVESIDVGVPVKLAYNQWTQFADFPKFTKKVENVDQPEEGKTTWKAQVFWSHRTWESTIVEQAPDDKIVWRSKGAKGYVDGAVTFHELAPNLTRILLVLEYHPQGLFERTGNIWRAQGRRARLELKNFRRHIMTEGLLHPDDIEGWRGVIQDGEVVESHEDAVAREEQDGSGQDGSGQEGDERSSRGQRSRRGRSTRSDAAQDEGETAEEDEDENAEESPNGERPGHTASRSGSSGRGRRAAERPRSSARSGGTERRQRAGSTAQRGGNS